MESISIIEHKTAKNVLVVFSARSTPKGKFTFSKRLNKIPATKIFVNDFSNNWYQNGVSDFPSHSQLNDYLQEQINKYKKDGGKLWTLGSSMGAYAALKIGSELNADRIVAFSPENKLGMKFSKSAESKVLVNGENAEISTLDYKPGADIIIISNNGDPVDYYSATKMKNSISNSKVYVLNNFKHNVLDEISKDITINTTIDTMLFEMISKGSSKSLSSIEKGKVYSASFADDFKEINENLIDGKGFEEKYIQTIEKIIKDNPGWGYANYLYALCLDKKGYYSAAMKYYESCFAISPHLGRPIIRLAELHASRNQHEDVLRYLEPFCRNKNNIKATNILSQTYRKLGLFYSAIDTYDLFISRSKNKNEKNTIEKQKNDLIRAI